MSLPRLIDNPACNTACGACHYKDLAYPAQLRRKQEWAAKQLGGEWSGVLGEIRSAPGGERTAYRAKTWLRSSLEGEELSFGMFRAVRMGAKWGEEFVSWNSCPLHALPIQRMIPALRRALAPFAGSLEGVWIGLPHVVVVARDESALERVREIDWSALLVAPFERAWFHANAQVGRKIFGHLPIHPLTGTASGSAEPIRAFRQIAQTLLAEARTEALSWLLREQPAQIVDLYCGTGALALELPPETGWLGIELAQDAARYADGLRPGANHAAFVGTVEHRLRDPRVLERIAAPYALYVNPPRSGLGEEASRAVLDLIAAKRPSAIAYLSCSASSLARDLRSLAGAGFAVHRLQPYDFFPQTEHFETLALLR